MGVQALWFFQELTSFGVILRTEHSYKLIHHPFLYGGQALFLAWLVE